MSTFQFKAIESFLPILSEARQVDILSHNKPIAEMLAKIETSRDKVERKAAEISELENELVQVDDQIADLKSQIKSIESRRGEVLGRKNSAAHHKRLAERAITETQARIGTFARAVIQRAAEAECRSIGKTLRMPGRRGGSMEVLEITKAYPRVGDPGSGASLGDYREQKGQHYEIRREPKPPADEPFFPEDQR